MKVAVLQIGYGDDESVADRVDRVAALVREQRGHDLVVLPELWAPGGFDYRAWSERAEPVDGPTAKAMGAAARDAGVTLHAGSIVERPPGGERGPEARTCGTPRWSSARTATCSRRTARSTGSASPRASRR